MRGPLHFPALLILYPFRYRDTLTGKWVRARYVAERQEIAARHTEWEIVGPGEVRRPQGRYFTPFASRLAVPKLGTIGQRFSSSRRIAANRLESTPESASWWACSCRLIVYEARKGRFDRVRNATDLLVEVVGAVSSVEASRTDVC